MSEPEPGSESGPGRGSESESRSGSETVPESRPGGRDRVALDTSALMLPVQADVRVFEELDRLVPDAEPVVPEAVLAELDALSRGGGTEGTAAGVGRDLADRCSILATSESYADDAVVELAAEGRVAYVATADRELADRVRSRGVPVIGLRSGNKLALNRP